MCACVYVCMCVCVYVHMRACVYMCVCVYVYVCMCVCVYVFMCVCVDVVYVVDGYEVTSEVKIRVHVPRQTLPKLLAHPTIQTLKTLN